MAFYPLVYQHWHPENTHALTSWNWHSLQSVTFRLRHFLQHHLDVSLLILVNWTLFSIADICNQENSYLLCCLEFSLRGSVLSEEFTTGAVCGRSPVCTRFDRSSLNSLLLVPTCRKSSAGFKSIHSGEEFSESVALRCRGGMSRRITRLNVATEIAVWTVSEPCSRWEPASSSFSVSVSLRKLKVHNK